METKSALYENGVRIPQFVYWQDSIPSGTVDKIVSTIDIAPTLFDFAGIDDPGYEYDGVSWKNEVLGGTQAFDGSLDKRCLVRLSNGFWSSLYFSSYHSYCLYHILPICTLAHTQSSLK